MPRAVIEYLEGGFYIVRTLQGFDKAVKHFDMHAQARQIFGKPCRSKLPALVAMRSIYDPIRGRLVQAKTLSLTGEGAGWFLELADKAGQKSKQQSMHALGDNVYIVNSKRGFWRAMGYFDYRATPAHTTGIPASFPAFVSIGDGWGGAVHANCLLLDRIADCFFQEKDRGGTRFVMGKV